MQYKPHIHHRRSIRLKGYDYSRAGLYFITICCQDRACMFGNVEHGEMILNDAGKMVESFAPNEPFAHTPVFSAIPRLVDDGNDNIITGQPQGIAPTSGNAVVSAIPSFANNVNGKTVGDMVGAFQSIVTVEYIRGVKIQGWQPFNGKLWQRNYWEHIIRNEQSYQRISAYIINNPSNWNEDKLYSR